MTLTTVRPCPKCKTGSLDIRVKRGALVKYALFWIDYKRYKCDNCRKKSYVIQQKVS